MSAAHASATVFGNADNRGMNPASASTSTTALPADPVREGMPFAVPPWLASERRFVLPVVGVVAALAAVLVLAVVAALWELRQDAIAAQHRALGTLSMALADELDRGLQGVVVALESTRAGLRAQAPALPGPTSQMLMDRAELLPLVADFWTLDRAGRVTAASTAAPPPPLDTFYPRPSVVPPPAPRDISISRPFAVDNREEVALLTALTDDAGQVVGWLLAGVPTREWEGAFAVARPSSDARQLVLRSDGVVLAGDLPPSMPASGLKSLVEKVAGVDGFVEARTLRHFPVRVLVMRDASSSLERWRGLARVVGAVLVLTLLAFATLLASLWRAERGRLRTERAWQSEQARVALAAAAAQEGYWEWRPAKSQLFVSRRMLTLLGVETLPAHQGLGPLLSRVHPDDAPALEAAFARQETATPPPAPPSTTRPGIDLPVRVRLPGDGEPAWRWLRWRGNIAQGADGRPELLAGVAFDVTQEREQAEQTQRLEAQLLQARKLEALGTLAGGVAHDFNNVLAALLGYAELAQQSAPEGSLLSHQLERVVQAGLRGKAVVARILSFSRGGSPRHETVFAVQPLARQVLDLLTPTMPPGVEARVTLDEPLLYTRGDATLCFEAVMNLCTNALQAMPHGGTITVRVASRHVGAEGLMLSQGELGEGDYVELQVEDTGTGIGADVMERLFEPFFTTRGQQGTGLGLSVVRGVAEEAGGAVDVSSQPGEGSRFTLYFPAHEPPPTEHALAGEVPQGEGQCVLVVDDDPALVALAEELLARLGYEPVGFSDPQQALAELREEPARFDAVLSDQIMPGMDGTTLAMRVRELRPDLPVLLVSGFGGPGLADRAQEAGVRQVLAKPLAQAELARALAGLFTPP